MDLNEWKDKLEDQLNGNDKARKEREADNEKFRTSTEGWSDSILPEGERPKYEMNKTKTYLDGMKESQRKLHKAIEPLAKKLCESYDTDREVRLDTDFTREAGGEAKEGVISWSCDLKLTGSGYMPEFLALTLMNGGAFYSREIASPSCFDFGLGHFVRQTINIIEKAKEEVK